MNPISSPGSAHNNKDKGPEEKSKNPSPNPTISLCMIVKNEGEYLGHCLDAVSDLVDEIIVVDTGSSDNTVEVAARYTDKIYHYQWEDDFSKARNFSLEFATGDWILVLDADESISARDFDKIRQIIRDSSREAVLLIQRTYRYDESLDGWQSNKGDYEEGRDYPGFTESRLVRLFRNQDGIRFRGRVHELVEYALAEQKKRIVGTDIPIHHFGEVRNRNAIVKKKEKYRKLGEDKIKDETLNAKAYLELGIQYMELGDCERAEDVFLQALSLNANLEEAYHNLGIICEKRGDTETAKCNYLKAIEIKPAYAAPYNNLANLFKAGGQSAEAEVCYRKGIEINPDNFVFHYNYALLLEKQSRLSEAVDAYLQALRLSPNHIDSLMGLGEVLFRMGKWEPAGEQFSRVLAINPNHIVAHCNLGSVYANKSQLDKAIDEFKMAVELDPQYGLAQRNLALAYYYAGHQALASEVCAVLSSMGLEIPAEIETKNR